MPATKTATKRPRKAKRPAWLSIPVTDSKIAALQKELVKPGKRTSYLHITLIHHVTEPETDKVLIERVIGGQKPLEMRAGKLEVWPVDGHHLLVLKVESTQLRELRAAMHGIRHEYSEHRFNPHITLGIATPEQVETLHGTEVDVTGRGFNTDVVRFEHNGKSEDLPMLGMAITATFSGDLSFNEGPGLSKSGSSTFGKSTRMIPMTTLTRGPVARIHGATDADKKERERLLPKADDRVRVAEQRAAADPDWWRLIPSVYNVVLYSAHCQLNEACTNSQRFAALSDYRMARERVVDDLINQQLRDQSKDGQPGMLAKSRGMSTLSGEDGGFAVRECGCGEPKALAKACCDQCAAKSSKFFESLSGRFGKSSKPEIRDADGDGLIYDGTKWERPVGGGRVATIDAPDGMTAADNVPQTETAEFRAWFGDSKVVDRNGNPIVLHTGQPPGYEIQVAERHELPSEAIFLTDDASIAEKYAVGDYSTDRDGVVHDVYARIENPLDLDKSIDSEWWEQSLMEWHDVDDPVEAIGREFNISLFYDDYQDKTLDKFEIGNRLVDSDDLDGILNLLWLENSGQGFTMEHALSDSPTGQMLVLANSSLGEAYLKENSYDGYMFRDSEMGGTTYVVMDPTQIKSAIGNSGTFDPNDPDIRKAASDFFTKLAPFAKRATFDESKHRRDSDGQFATKGSSSSRKPSKKKTPKKSRQSSSERRESLSGLRAQQVSDMKHAMQYAKDVLTFNMRDDDIISQAIQRQKESGQAVMEDLGYAVDHAKNMLTLQPGRSLVGKVAKSFKDGGKAQDQSGTLLAAISGSAIGKLLKLTGVPFKLAAKAARKIYKYAGESAKQHERLIEAMRDPNSKRDPFFGKAFAKSSGGDDDDLAVLVSAVKLEAGDDPTPEDFQEAILAVVRKVLSEVEGESKDQAVIAKSAGEFFGKLSSRFRKASKPEIRDADGDGLIYDGTKWERPVGSVSASDTSRVPQTETAEFRAWFGDSKVVDENGDPKVVYHGTVNDFTEFNVDAQATSGRTFGNGVYLTTSPDQAAGYAKGRGAIMPVYVRMENPIDLEGDLTEAQRESISRVLSADIGRQRISYHEGSRVRKVFSESDKDKAYDLFDQRLEHWEQHGQGYDRYMPTESREGNKFIVEYTDTSMVDLPRNARDAWNRMHSVWGDEFTRKIAKTGIDGVITGRILVVPDPTQIKSAIGNSGVFDPNNPDIRKAASDFFTRLGA